MARRSNALYAAILVVTASGMLGLTFASVRLYRLFCQATGYAGTPDTTSGKQAPGAEARTVVVRFDANVAPGLPWVFHPDQESVTVHLGKSQIATYTAQNKADQPITGVALYNVTPSRVGLYFHKTACFCFNKQTLLAHQGMHFPLSFWVDPKLATDPDTRDVHTITLSYTFFHSLKDAAKSGALADAGPHVGPQADLPDTPAPSYGRP